MNFLIQNRSLFFKLVIVSSLTCVFSFTEGSSINTVLLFQQVETDTTKNKSDSSAIITPTDDSNYFNFKDRYGDPLNYYQSPSPFLLNNPSNYNMNVEVDTGMNYTITEKMGDLDYRPSSTFTFEQYDRLHSQKMYKNYWKDMSSGLDGESAVSGRRLIPPIYISPVFDRIFGGSYVDIRPNGFVTLDFGGKWQRVQNPSIPIRQQKNGGFEFDQQISMNVVGKIGEKMSVTANFDNNNTFDFENDLKVEYTGFEEDIIQKIEIGNVSLPLQNTLITGAQNLFGVKTQLRFGKMYVTAVASTQRGKSESIQINGGSDGGQGREFEIRASDYDENRHFFLGHFFRDNYESWLKFMPQVTSRVNINRIEVYIINRQNNTQTLRNVAAFMDLGEGKVIYNNEQVTSNTGNQQAPNANNANTLYQQLSNDPSLRTVDNLNSIVGLTKGTDFELVTTARKLDLTEYNFNTELGLISLNRKLQNDEMLAVAYEYTYQGQKFKVGELTEDYQNLGEESVIFLKLLRPTKINSSVPTWDLMMKNVYNLNASQITRDAFQLRIIYRDDKTGIDNPSLHEGINTTDVPLIEISGLDRLNSNNDPQKDGNFDFVENITIIPETGLVFFPVVEPFGSNLEKEFDPTTEAGLIDKYVFDKIYNTTKADAELDTYHNKYFLSGRMQAGSSSEIMLPGINIAEGSVVVMAGSQPLTEEVDYRVDYNIGRVVIINEAVLNSGKPINIRYEKSDLFNFQTRSLIGTRMDYQFSENFNIGGTFLYHNERPFISRVSIGDEPTRNMKYGFDINFQDESRLLTRIVDAIPLIQTKEPSNVTFNAEFAQLIPGTSNKVNGKGTSYIDDFESTATPFSLSNSIENWKLASTPVTQNNEFTGVPPSQASNNVRINDKRAKLAWYIIDNIFYRSSGTVKPSNINDQDLQNNYVRNIPFQEIFPNRDNEVLNSNLRIFDMAYYPMERGPYNYNTNLNSNAELPNPEENWGGITRSITSDVDFDKNNIEYIEFWLMDPFIQGVNGQINDGRGNLTNNTTGGKLVFNLGSISEDVMKDSKHAFENGLPADGIKADSVNGNFNNWGFVTSQQYLTNSFDNTSSARPNQDIGLDGLNSSEEADHFSNYLDNLSSGARNIIEEDPSGDDFQYYLGGELDSRDAKILERYKNFNNTEGNSPILSNNNQSFTPSGTNLPDNEDLNRDNTLSDVEDYYEYELDLRPGDLTLDNKYIVDKVTSANHPEASWYLFRIPVREPTGKQGNIEGFKSIRFLRTYLTQFQQPVVLRMANFQLIGAQWRKYDGNLYERGLYETPEPYNPDFFVSVVNIEENGTATDGKIPYVEPPGIQRDYDNTSPIVRRNNEQSMVLCVDDLQDRDARAVFKNLNIDLINYGRMKMFIHAQENGKPLNDGDIHAFLRIGTDQEANYYEVELPLMVTPNSATSPEEIWPAENEMDILFDDLYEVKKRRNNANWDIDVPYTETIGRYQFTVRGRPDLSAARSMMIGIRNPRSDPDESPKSVCVWVNELRVTDFDRTAGWAANAYLGMKLADLGTVSASTRYTSFGFGGVQSKIQERTREETFEYDVSTNINLDKFLPEKTGLKIPMYASFEKRTITPKFDPKDPDIPLDAALDAIDNEQDRKEYRDIVIEDDTRRSINFTNVRKEKVKEDAKPHIYDIENLSFTYAYSERKRSNFNIQSYEYRSYRGSVAYNYSPKPLELAPLKKSKAFSSPYLQLIKDFNVNFAPSNLNFRVELDRKFTRTQLRNANLGIAGIQPTWEKYFFFNRIYGLSWNLTKSISLDYNARVNAIVDEPFGDIDTQAERDVIKENFFKLGRTKTYNQSMGANYRLPLDKFPITSWISSDIRYAVGYNWRAGAYSEDPEFNQQAIFGNLIENSQDVNVSGKIDFVKLYNKNKYLKSINTPSRRRTSSRTRPTAQDTVKAKPEMKGVKGFLRLLMSVRSVNVTYNVRSATILPGFNKTPFLLGMDSSWNAPGWKFLLGSQDPEIRNIAAQNDWLVYDTILTQPFSQVRQIDLSIRANLEPAKDLKIQLDVKKRAMGNYEELFEVNRDANNIGVYNRLLPTRTGSYSISYNMIGTSFINDDDEFNNAVFENFTEYREIIRNRLGSDYAINSQDVLVPAFIAAYSKKDPKTISTSPFPKIPIPGWRVDYSGLTKIGNLKDVFSSISLTHGYRSDYTVNNYSTSLEYAEDPNYYNYIELDRDLSRYPKADKINESGELIPVFLMSQVILHEEFSPLIGVNIRTRKKLTARVEYKRSREVGLNFSNAQVTEIKTNDLTMDIGYTKAGMRMPFKSQGRIITLENDLSFKMTFTIRDTKTIQRKIDDINTPTNGMINLQFRPQIGYVLSQRLNLNVYFERSINDPLVSSSFKRTTTAAGVQLRFSLAQ